MIPDAFSHSLVEPVISPVVAVEAVNVTTNELLEPVLHVFDGTTVTLPEVVPKSTVIDVVPSPLAIDAPVGTVQV